MLASSSAVKEFLMDNVMASERRDEIFACEMSAQSNKKKRFAWEQITNKYNKKSTTGIRTTESLQKLWDNLKRICKEERSKCDKEARKTGGGPPPPPISQISQIVDDIFGDASEPYFTGESTGIDTLNEINSTGITLSKNVNQTKGPTNELMFGTAITGK
uniref:Regulatory protein zeste n=1 Tax=Romanomermis culicivorax TaxID=13658 RepID=A0A915IHJ1_ROMCU